MTQNQTTKADAKNQEAVVPEGVEDLMQSESSGGCCGGACCN